MPPLASFLGPVLAPIPVIGPILAGIVTIVGALFGGIFGGSANDNIIKAFNGLRDALVQTANKLMKFAWSIALALGNIFNLLKWIWGNVLGPLVKAIRGIVDQIGRVLNKILKPILDAMKAQRAAILDLYNRFVRPIIVAIEKVRRLIHFFQLLHIHIFDGLDRVLGRIEGKVLAPIYALLYRANTLGNWINFILNLHALIYRGLFLGSMNATRGGSFSLLAGAPPLGMTALPFAPSSSPGAAAAPSFTAFDATANTALATDLPKLATDPQFALVIPLLTISPAGAGAAQLLTLQNYLAEGTGVTV